MTSKDHVAVGQTYERQDVVMTVTHVHRRWSRSHQTEVWDVRLVVVVADEWWPAGQVINHVGLREGTLQSQGYTRLA